MSSHEGPLLPSALPVGTEVGSWRVVGLEGRGAYGTVYRVEREGEEGARALKLATFPGDRRFEREGELLTRIRHENVPGLRERGWWRHPSGVSFPYLVMERVEGVSLYEWASERGRTRRQVLGVLAQLARAVEATHRAEAVHRDVKGDNVRVSREGRAWLMDFGVGDYKGASPLTSETLPPGTPEYRSPQALLFRWEQGRQGGARYKATPADDVYALGVMGWRAVTGSYPPPSPVVERALEPSWPVRRRRVRPSELATVGPELEELLLRMLSEEPEERGSAGELARALERAASSAQRGLDEPITRRAGQALCKRKGLLGRVRPGLVLAVGTLAVAVGAAVLIRAAPGTALPSEEPPRVAQEVRGGSSEDGGTAALGDGAPLTPEITATLSRPSKGLKLNMPKRPFTGQRLPPCERDFEVEIELTEGQKDTRSCWIEVKASAAACKKKGYEYRGGCYLPSYPPPKLPQSIGP